MEFYFSRQILMFAHAAADPERGEASVLQTGNNSVKSKIQVSQ
jgi:hypothetical protein